MKKNIKSDAVKILMVCVYATLVFMPIVRLFVYMDRESIVRVISSPVFAVSIKNSIFFAMIATVISVVLALILAVSIERTDIKYKNIFITVLTLPMLVPSVSIGMGITILFGNSGIITELLNISQGIYGFWGIVMGSVLYSFPVAFLMLSDIIRYEDGSPYEAAQILGFSDFRQFKTITLPYLKRPLITVVFATFTLIITDYGVPLMVGGKYTTIPVVMYQEVIGQLDFGKGSVYGCLLLIPAFMAFVIDLFNMEKDARQGEIKSCLPSKQIGKKVMAYILSVLVSLYMLLPIVSFVLISFAKDYPKDIHLTFANVIKAINLQAGRYWFHSVIIALLVSLFGIMVSFLTAYLSARMKSKFSGFLHLSAMLSAAIPGIVLGLAYVISFKTTPIYGTIIILVLVNLIHFISSPYLMIYNSLNKINSNLESVGEILGISRCHMIKDVFIPMTRNTLIEMFAYFFVNSMMTISAVSFLANTSNKPVSLMINQFEAQMQYEIAAVVSLIILLSNLIVKGICYLLKRDYNWSKP